MSNGRLTKHDLSPSLAQEIDNTAAQAQDLETRSEELATQLAQTPKYPTLFFEVGVTDESFPYGDPKRYGAVGDGISDDTQAIKNALLSHAEVILNDGTFLITEHITVPTGKSLSCTNTGYLVTITDIDMIKLQGESKLRYMNIKVNMPNGYTSNVIECSSRTFGDVTRKAPEIHDITIMTDKQTANTFPGTILHIWTGKRDEEGIEYTFEGVSFLNAYNIRVLSGKFKYFCRFYTYQHSTAGSAAEGYLTTNHFHDIFINDCTYGFFGSKDETTLNDRRYNMGGRNRFDRVTMQGGVSENMFVLTGGVQHINDFMPWDWTRWHEDRRPILIVDGSDTLLNLNHLPRRGTLLDNVKMSSYPSIVKTDKQKEAYIKRYLAKPANIEDVTQPYTQNNVDLQIIASLNAGDVYLLSEVFLAPRLNLTFKVSDFNAGGVLGQQEGRVLLAYDNTTQDLRVSIFPYLNLENYGEFYANKITKEGNEYVQFYFKCTNTMSHGRFYHYNVGQYTYLQTRNIVFSPQKVTNVTDFSGMLLATNVSIAQIPVTTTNKNPYARTGAMMLDSGKDLFMGKSEKRGWKPLAEIISGDTANRPVVTEVGYCYFDTTLQKPLWWGGSVWKDSTGATV